MQFKPPRRIVHRVFIHCSASDNPLDDNIKIIRAWHLKRGFTAVGYHYFIRKDGTLEVGRDLEMIPAAQKDNNAGTLAICLHGLAKDKFTEKQFETLRELCQQIDSAYDGKITFHGHCEVSDKTCPVFDYKEVLKLNDKGYIIKDVMEA